MMLPTQREIDGKCAAHFQRPPFKAFMQLVCHRAKIIDRLQREPEIKVLLLESVCTDKLVSLIPREIEGEMS